MTPQQENLKEVIERYRSWLTSGFWSSTYFKSKWHWKSEIQEHIKKLEVKLKTSNGKP